MNPAKPTQMAKLIHYSRDRCSVRFTEPDQLEPRLARGKGRGGTRQICITDRARHYIVHPSVGGLPTDQVPDGVVVLLSVSRAGKQPSRKRGQIISSRRKGPVPCSDEHPIRSDQTEVRAVHDTKEVSRGSVVMLVIS
jgi:hypothetical protein